MDNGIVCLGLFRDCFQRIAILAAVQRTMIIEPCWLATWTHAHMLACRKLQIGHEVCHSHFKPCFNLHAIK